MLIQSILKAILGTSSNIIEITKAPNGGFIIHSEDCIESNLCQYQTWELTNLDLYVDKDGVILDGDYGIENISQPSCDEINSSVYVCFKDKGFNSVLERNYNNAKEKPELNKVVKGLISVLEYMKIHDKVVFKYRYATDEVSEFEYKPFIKSVV